MLGYDALLPLAALSSGPPVPTILCTHFMLPTRAVQLLGTALGSTVANRGIGMTAKVVGIRNCTYITAKGMEGKRI